MLKEMPKIDLHCHLDGSMGIRETMEILNGQGKNYTEEEARGKMQVSGDCDSLAEYLKCFDLPIQCIQTEEGLRKTSFGLAAAAAAENVTYLEVRFAPSFCTVGGLSVKRAIEAVQKGLFEAERKTGIHTGIIVCAMRNLDLDTNRKMLSEARELFGAGVVACDLAGDEKAYPTALFRELFHEARKLEMPFTIHSGECGSRDNIREAIELGAKRLGHGIAMRGDKELMTLCARHRVGIELCPTSNFQTKAVADWKDYPLAEFMNHGLPVSINTDNRTVSGTDCTLEWMKVMEHFELSQDDLGKIYRSSVEMAFASDECKEELIRKWS